MAALIDYDLANSGTWDWETDPELSTEPQGFDTVKARICYRGTSQGLLALFSLGAQNCPGYSTPATPRPMYYCGPRVLEARFGFQIAELEWKGFSRDYPDVGAAVISETNGIGHVIAMEYGMTTQEALFPQERDGVTVYWPHPDKSGEAAIRRNITYETGAIDILVASVPWRVRLIGRVYTCSLRGITIGPVTDLFRPPRLMTTLAPGATDPHKTINWANLPDPLVTVADGVTAAGGWVCRNYSKVSDHQVGDKTLRAWKADYEWVERHGP